MRVLSLALLMCSAAALPFSISNVFGDHMVLQRDRPVIVWGFGASGSVVTTTFRGQELKGTTDGVGVWRIAFPPSPASVNPVSFTFTSTEGKSATLADVLYGDVHICSGQSNMQMTVKNNVPNMTDELRRANNYPLIRLFTVGQGNQSNTPFLELASIEQRWSVASEASVGVGGWSAFSAVCWFTYREVFDSLGGTVPQGLISNNWGGTPIQHWSSPEALAVCKGGKDSVLWNAMVVPYTVGPMAIRTGIWYQGEANIGNAGYYACQMSEMIADWRRKLPGLGTFGIVQIAPCTCYNVSPQSADLRQSQLAPLYTMSRIAFATTVDLVWPFSAPSDIHPTNKQVVGIRLAAQVLQLEYGREVGPTIYPMYAGASAWLDGPTAYAHIELTGCQNGCRLIENPVVPPGVPANNTATWAIQASDRLWYPAKAQIVDNGNGVELIADVGAGKQVIATSYGRNSYPINAAVGRNGLPLVGWCFDIAGRPCWESPAAEYELPAFKNPEKSMEFYAFASHVRAESVN